MEKDLLGSNPSTSTPNSYSRRNKDARQRKARGRCVDREENNRRALERSNPNRELVKRKES